MTITFQGIPFGLCLVIFLVGLICGMVGVLLPFTKLWNDFERKYRKIRNDK